MFQRLIKSGTTPLYLVLILLLASFLRLLALDFQSLWLDELYTMNMANPANSWGDIYRLSFTHDPLSVLYFILLTTFFKLLGYSAFSAKLFSALFGIASVLMCFLLGKKLVSERAGLFAAFLMAVNPFSITYSQEARVYTMYLFTAALSFYCLLNFIRDPKNKTAIFYGVSVLFMLLSHFFGFFVLFSQVCIYLFFALRDKRLSLLLHLRFSALAAGVCLLGYLPFIPIFIMLTKSKGTWIDPPGMDALLRLYRDFQGGSWILFTIGVLLMLWIGLARWNKSDPASRNGSNKDAVIFLCLWIGISFLVPFLLSVFHFPIFYKRYMISYLSPFILLSAIGLTQITQKWLRIAAVLIVCLGTWYHLFPSTHYYSRIAKSDFRGISDFILQHNQANLPVYTTLPYHFGYYFRAADSEEMIQSNNLDSLCNGMRKGNLPMESFWFADAHGRAFSVTEANQAYLDSHFDLFLLQESFDSWARLYLKKENLPTNAKRIQRGDMLNGSTPSSALFVNGSLKSLPLILETGTYQLVAKVMGTPFDGVNGSSSHVKWQANNIGIADYYTGLRSFTHGDTLNYTQEKTDTVSFELIFDNDTCYGNKDRNVLFRDLLLLPVHQEPGFQN